MNRRLKRLIELIKIIKPNHILMMSNGWHYHKSLESLLDMKGEVKRIYRGIIPKKSDSRASFLNLDNHNFVFHSLYHPSRFNYVSTHNSLLKETMPKFLEYIQS